MIHEVIDKALNNANPVRFPFEQTQNARQIALLAKHAREDLQAESDAALNAWISGNPIKMRDFTPKPWEAGYVDVTDEPLIDIVHLIETDQITVVRVGNRWMARAT